MTSMRDQNVNARAEGHGPNVLQFPTRSAVTQTDSNTGVAAADGQKEDTTSLYDKIARFDFTKKEWSAGETAILYRQYLVSADVPDRENLYLKTLGAVIQGVVSSASLLPFVIFEPNRKLVSQAVCDFLMHRNCHLDDEFAGVHEVVEILVSNQAVNKGAILAGLVALGDRRVNAVARAARHLLTAEDIRSFSRYHINRIRSSSVEFCLDWLIELNQGADRLVVTDLGCALMLMVFHDELGLVEDLSEINYVGFKNTKVLQTKTFERYFSEIMPTLEYLKNCEGFETVIQAVIDAWRDHESKAAKLRAHAEA